MIFHMYVHEKNILKRSTLHQFHVSAQQLVVDNSFVRYNINI